MAMWGKTDAAADSPFMAAQQLKKKANSANRTALYGNTTTTAGVFAVDKNEIHAAATNHKGPAHTGWVLRKLGTGSIVSLSVSAGGTGYSNTDVLNVAAPTTGGTNAAGTIATDANGTITAVTLTSKGSGFTSKTPTVAVANSTGGASTGTGATFAAVAGGKAGRIFQEVLAAIGITTDNAADDTIYPNA